MPHINFNGKILKDNTPIISANNRGLRFGDGLFETIKIQDDKLIFAHQHFKRLWKGLHILQFDIPKHFTTNLLHEAIVILAKKNKHNILGRIRLTVFKSNGGLYDAVNNLPNYIIETWQLPTSAEQLNTNGLNIAIYYDAKKSIDTLSNIKHNNYLPNVLAANFAIKNKCNDAIILNSLGNICETTITNIFLIKNKIIYTPSLAQGCVAGIMRTHAMAILATNNFICIEKEITINELLQADEVFLTNSIKKIQWVQNIDNKMYKNDSIQKIYSSYFQ